MKVKYEVFDEVMARITKYVIQHHKIKDHLSLKHLHGIEFMESTDHKGIYEPIDQIIVIQCKITDYLENSLTLSHELFHFHAYMRNEDSNFIHKIDINRDRSNTYIIFKKIKINQEVYEFAFWNWQKIKEVQYNNPKSFA
jgi:hypothetical protein